MPKINRSRLKIAIIGSSAPSCLYALFLKKNNYDVTIYESSNKIGGAWGVDKNGPKFSNIIYPLTNKEKKIFKKSINILKKNYRITFKKNFYKTLFSKKIVNASSCNLNGLFNLTRKKIKININSKVESITEADKFVIINNKYYYDYVFFPIYTNLKFVKIFKNKKVNKILLPFLKLNNALHLRMLVSNLKKKNYNFRNMTIGPLDRLQITSIKKSIYQINGRVTLEWKKKKKKQILKKIKNVLGFDKVISLKFFIYRSCIRNDKQINILKNKLKLTKRIKYLETFTFLEFLRVNIFSNYSIKSILK